MDTTQKPVPRAPLGGMWLDDAAQLVGYSPEYLRTLKYRDRNDPPPLRKARGRLWVYPHELEAWAHRRDGLAS